MVLYPDFDGEEPRVQEEPITLEDRVEILEGRCDSMEDTLHRINETLQEILKIPSPEIHQLEIPAPGGQE